MIAYFASCFDTPIIPKCWHIVLVPTTYPKFIGEFIVSQNFCQSLQAYLYAESLD